MGIFDNFKGIWSGGDIPVGSIGIDKDPFDPRNKSAGPQPDNSEFVPFNLGSTPSSIPQPEPTPTTSSHTESTIPSSTVDSPVESYEIIHRDDMELTKEEFFNMAKQVNPGYEKFLSKLDSFDLINYSILTRGDKKYVACIVTITEGNNAGSSYIYLTHPDLNEKGQYITMVDKEFLEGASSSILAFNAIKYNLPIDERGEVFKNLTLNYPDFYRTPAPKFAAVREAIKVLPDKGTHLTSIPDINLNLGLNSEQKNELNSFLKTFFIDFLNKLPDDKRETAKNSIISKIRSIGDLKNISPEELIQIVR